MSPTPEQAKKRRLIRELLHLSSTNPWSPDHLRTLRFPDTMYHLADDLTTLIANYSTLVNKNDELTRENEALTKEIHHQAIIIAKLKDQQPMVE